MSLRSVATSTLAIVEERGYRAPSGAWVALGPALDRALGGTRLYRPDDLTALIERPAGGGPAPRVEVTEETTCAAARRLAAAGPVCLLAFASAKNPGGGFLGGAKAQEEDLARCSALYPCQLTQRAYYDANRGCAPSMLYTDHVIHAPAVPFFRDDRLDLLDEPYLASVITAPAPNAGEALRRSPAAAPAIAATLARRAAMVLAVAEERGDRRLVLGAWGCGVFRNDPDQVARLFAALLASPRFGGAFDEVVFAILDRSREQRTLAAFRRVLGS